MRSRFTQGGWSCVCRW